MSVKERQRDNEVKGVKDREREREREEVCEVYSSSEWESKKTFTKLQDLLFVQ